MVQQIIKAFPEEKKKISDNQLGKVPYLNISEFYYDTIQGEGIHIGHPAAFLRLQGCPLGCVYCDTTEVWWTGNPYTISELIEMISHTRLLGAVLTKKHHLVITGGSPLLQQDTLIVFIKEFIRYFGCPYIEIENECTIMPEQELSIYTSCWNNSPKLESSGVSREKRYKPGVIRKLAGLDNSWFKFVISSEQDWEEIQFWFLDAGLIQRNQIILMPEGATRAELDRTRETTIQLAIREGVRYSDRLHIQVWDKKVGI